MTTTWLELLFKGGPIMLALAACSLFALALIADRAIHLLTTREDARALEKALELAAADPSAAAQTLRQQRGSVAALWRAGLDALPEGKESAERAMQIEGVRQLARAERGMPILGSIIALTPMLGFLGTILGLIRAFMNWERVGADVQVGDLAGGMYEAMITTAAALSVAIPYYLLYTMLASRVAGRARRLEIAHETFIRRLAPRLAVRPLAPTTLPDQPGERRPLDAPEDEPVTECPSPGYAPPNPDAPPR
jgi:biopolymer transport protein ExbB